VVPFQVAPLWGWHCPPVAVVGGAWALCLPSPYGRREPVGRPVGVSVGDTSVILYRPALSSGPAHEG